MDNYYNRVFNVPSNKGNYEQCHFYIDLDSNSIDSPEGTVATILFETTPRTVSGRADINRKELIRLNEAINKYLDDTSDVSFP